MYSLTQPPGGPVAARITVAPDQPFTLAQAIVGPTVSKRFDPNFGINVETYDDQATFAVPIRVASNAPRGHTSVALTARFQTCNATLCLPPRTERLTVPITVAVASTSAVASGR
jgi:Disulphide bond corrector protein DsbC